MKALTLVLTVLLLSACASRPAPSQVDLVTYTPAHWPEPLQADIWRPTPAAGQRAPAMLMVHGGGWERRSREDMDRLSRHYAERGFVVMNVSYRFAPEHRFPAQLHDLQQAMHWLHRHADELGIDRQRIAAFGYSAGAHLVSLLALTAGTGEALDHPYGGAVTRPAVVIAGGSPMDLRKYPGGKLVPQFLGGRIDEVPEIFAAASPVTHVHAEAPPFFLFHGGRDRLVTIDHAEEFKAALTALAVPVELYRQRGRGHVLAFLTLGDALEQADRFLDQTLSD
jgi:acetyl esterase/lipase